MIFEDEPSVAEAARILGILPPFTDAKIRAGYRKAAMKAHPDHGGSVEEFQKVTAAKKVLTTKGASTWAHANPFHKQTSRRAVHNYSVEMVCNWLILNGYLKAARHFRTWHERK